MISQIQPDTKLPKMKFYRVYTALMSQSTTAAPTVRVLQNTLEFEPVWVYNNVGTYTVTTDQKFPTEKTTLIAANNTGWNGGIVRLDNLDGSNLELQTRNSAGNLANGILYENMIEIRIYE